MRQEKALWGAQCCFRAPQQLGRAAWHECACALAGGRREAGALYSEFGVVMGRLFCEAVRFSACRSLQMPGGQNSPNTMGCSSMSYTYAPTTSEDRRPKRVSMGFGAKRRWAKKKLKKSKKPKEIKK